METEYYKTKESVDEYINLAKDVSGKELIEKLKSFLMEGATLLEIGSGPGTDYKLLKKNYDVTGSDNSIEFLKHLRSSNSTGNFLELDAVTLEVEQTFDGIYSNKVLHHLSDKELADSIMRQYAILNEGGIICHSFWKGQGSEVFKGMFVNYHDQDVKVFLGEFFEIILMEAYPEFEEGDSLLLIAKKK